MKDIEYFYDLLEKSDVTVIGYNTRQERIKDIIISKLPHLQLTEVDSDFSLKPFLRNLKLDVLLEGGESVTMPKYLIVDLQNFSPSRIGRFEISNIITNIRCDMYTMDPYQSFYKLILLSQVNTNLNGDALNISNFSCGTTPIFMSDLTIIMGSESMKIIKNRFESNDIEVSYK